MIQPQNTKTQFSQRKSNDINTNRLNKLFYINRSNGVIKFLRKWENLLYIENNTTSHVTNPRPSAMYATG